MSAGSYLPPEIRNYIVDFLRDEPETLKQCCIASKSWVPRTRKHLFGTVIIGQEHHLEAWKKTFPDLLESPAYHARTLFIGCPHAITTGDAEVGGWIRTFYNVVNLEVWTSLGLDDRDVSLVPFHNFTPILKSLRVFTSSIPRSRILDLVCSLPLLEDLAVIDHTHIDGLGGSDWYQDGFQPSTSPALTGTLELNLKRRMEPTARLLLDLPNGLHFRKLVCRWEIEENVLWTRALVEACSDTLERVDLQVWNSASPSFPLRPGPQLNLVFAAARWNTSLDFSNTPRLKEVVFRVKTRSAVWMTLALETITPDHRDFHQITIHVPEYGPSIANPTNLRKTFGESFYNQWMDLDRLLVQLWESRGIRPKIVCQVEENERGAACEYIGCLFPEIMERGLI